MTPTTIGAMLAVGAALALNASYLMQHVGSSTASAVDVRRPVATLVALVRSPLWLVGGIVGLTGWGLHIGAMREAPLSVVQAFVAGGLAIAAPMSAIGLRRRLAPAEIQAIALMVLALLAISIGLHGHTVHGGFPAPALGAWVGGLALAAAALAVRVRGPHRALALGLAGGLLYGAADLAVKALTGLHGGVLVSPWLPVAALASAGAFFAFQRGLQSDRPLAVIALMTAATNVSSIAGAFVVFGDPLGRTPALALLHVAAFALVVVAGWRLAPVHARLAEAPA